jgi:hypothetical protein
MKNGRDKEQKEEAKQQPRKDEDENQTNEASGETIEKKDDDKTVYCVSCEKESSGYYKCSVCDQFVHAVCGGYSEDSEGFGHNVTCNLCVWKNRIIIQREGAKSDQRQQDQNMISHSNSRLSAVVIGPNVVVRVPDGDRGRLAPRNVLVVILGIKCSGLYQLGTKEGLLERLCARNEFTTDDNFIDAHDVPSSSLPLRSAQ